MIEAILAALFGLLIGSFLNVCIFRLPYDLTPLNPRRSFCPKCEKTIEWYDNIPILSYFLLGGKCRNCKESISYRYPLVEFLTAVCFSIAVYRYGATWQGLRLAVFSAVCIDLIFTDFEERILPDEFTYGGAILGLLFAFKLPLPTMFGYFFLSGETRQWILSPVESVLAGLFCGGLIWLTGAFYEKVRKQEGMGLGDVKMVGMLGAYLGLMPALYVLFLGNALGAIAGLFYALATKQKVSTYPVPLGSSLGVAALAVTLLGPHP